MPYFIALLMTILMLIGMVFNIIWETFHGSISLNSVLLLLLVNFVSGFRLELMYISHIESIWWSLTHLLVFSCLYCCHFFQNQFFHLYQKVKSSESKIKFSQASNGCKRVLQAAKLPYANGTKEYITSQKLGSHDFWQIANSVLNKGKSAIPPLFNGLEVLSSASDKAKLLARDFWQIANSVLNKGKSAIPPLFNGPELLSSVSDKAELFPENFSNNSNLDASGILTCFPF